MILNEKRLTPVISKRNPQSPPTRPSVPTNSFDDNFARRTPPVNSNRAGIGASLVVLSQR